TGADGTPTKETQASLVYDELKRAFPDRHFVFSKPDLKPGDNGYTEIPAPKVSQDGLQISTKENRITLDSDTRLADGTLLPKGSQCWVGTTFDGKEVKSADPQGKVWAVTPEGQYVAVTGDGQSAPIEASAVSHERNKMGQVVDRVRSEIDPAT